MRLILLAIQFYKLGNPDHKGLDDLAWATCLAGAKAGFEPKWFYFQIHALTSMLQFLKVFIWIFFLSTVFQK